ncbi:MAG: PD40 domain-containing protein [Chloroflexi bacterium]|nr:PD40 domain-containing protein [Chloroflexota bacterium]
MISQAARLLGLLIILAIFLACNFSSLAPTVEAVPTEAIPLPPTSNPTPTLDRASFASTGLIVFTRFSDVSVDLFTYNAETGEERRLTNTLGASLQPRWSPDGRFLSYLYFDSETDQVNIWILDIQAGPPGRPVTQGGIGGFPLLSWSPDNHYLLFWGTPKDDPTANVILRLDVNSGQIDTLTADYTKWNAYPAWSPDGSRIAFVTNRPGDLPDTTNDIWLINAGGSSPVILVQASEPGWDESKPAWSPDGGQVAFFRYPSPVADRSAHTLSQGLWAINVDAGIERLIHEFENAEFSQAPVWSPDGSWIAFTIGQFDQIDVWLVPAAGGQAVNISNLPGEEGSLAWSPDSAWLLFTNTFEGGTFIYIVDLDRSGARQLLPGGSGYADWGPFSSTP